jgi:hypothetical protein
VRPKIGFCNCATGVADDDEVDRVTDLDLIGEQFASVQTGQEVHFAGMPGRARLYSIQRPNGPARPAVGFAVSRGCDVVVGVIQGKLAASPEIQRAASELLSSDPLTAWLDSILGGR